MADFVSEDAGAVKRSLMFQIAAIDADDAPVGKIAPAACAHLETNPSVEAEAGGKTGEAIQFGVDGVHGEVPDVR
jgi:hypothetical protein